MACLLCRFGTDRPIHPTSCCHQLWSDQYHVHCTTLRPAWRTLVRHSWWPERTEKLHACSQNGEMLINWTNEKTNDRQRTYPIATYLSNALAASRRPRARPLWARAVFSTIFKAVFRSMLASGLRTLCMEQGQKNTLANYNLTMNFKIGPTSSWVWPHSEYKQMYVCMCKHISQHERKDHKRYRWMIKTVPVDISHFEFVGSESHTHTHKVKDQQTGTTKNHKVRLIVNTSWRIERLARLEARHTHGMLVWRSYRQSSPRGRIRFLARVGFIIKKRTGGLFEFCRKYFFKYPSPSSLSTQWVALIRLFIEVSLWEANACLEINHDGLNQPRMTFDHDYKIDCTNINQYKEDMSQCLFISI